MSGFYSESNKRGLKTLIWQHSRNRSSKGKMLELLQSERPLLQGVNVLLFCMFGQQKGSVSPRGRKQNAHMI